MFVEFPWRFLTNPREQRLEEVLMFSFFFCWIGLLYPNDEEQTYLPFRYRLTLWLFVSKTLVSSFLIFLIAILWLRFSYACIIHCHNFYCCKSWEIHVWFMRVKIKRSTVYRLPWLKGIASPPREDILQLIYDPCGSLK